jgi:hypothetical protein
MENNIGKNLEIFAKAMVVVYAIYLFATAIGYLIYPVVWLYRKVELLWK